MISFRCLGWVWRLAFGIAAGLALTACTHDTVGQDDGRIAPLLDGLGDHHMPITTDDSMAQRYFDQGLVLAYGFNHAEAARSFREAARRDPDCAMCHWGEGLVLGPNINAGMPDDHVPTAHAALQQAEHVHREDLERFLDNGWSLFGLAESRRAHGQTMAAVRVQERFEDAWRHADVNLSSSRI